MARNDHNDCWCGSDLRSHPGLVPGMDRGIGNTRRFRVDCRRGDLVHLSTQDLSPALGTGSDVGVSVMLLAYPTAGSAAVTTPGPTGNQQQTWAPAGTGGWTRDFLENFDAPLNTNVWGRYNGRSAASTMSTWVPSNVYTCHVSRAAAHQYDQYQWRVDLGWCFQRARGRADSGSMARQGKNRPRPGNRLCILAPCSTRPVLVGRRRSI